MYHIIKNTSFFQLSANGAWSDLHRCRYMPIFVKVISIYPSPVNILIYHHFCKIIIQNNFKSKVVPTKPALPPDLCLNTEELLCIMKKIWNRFLPLKNENAMRTILQEYIYSIRPTFIFSSTDRCLHTSCHVTGGW